MAGDIIVRACLDDDGDEWCDLPSTYISATVLFMYQGTPQFGLSGTTGRAGTLVLGGVLPGVYTVSLLDYEDDAPGTPLSCYIPYHDNAEWAMLSAGQQEVLVYRFWANGCSTPQPSATRTPTATPIVAYTRTATRTPTPAVVGVLVFPAQPGWFPNLARIEGLRCGRRLRECGEWVHL